MLNLVELDNQYMIDVDYNTNKYSHEMATRWIHLYFRIIDEICDNRIFEFSELNTIDEIDIKLVKDAYSKTNADQLCNTICVSKKDYGIEDSFYFTIKSKSERPVITDSYGYLFLGSNRWDCTNTGWMARICHNGNLEIMGPSDRLIRMEGGPVNLWQIENKIGGYQDILSCHASFNDEKQIKIACIELRPDFDLNEFTAWCKSTLPNHMIPDLFYEGRDLEGITEDALLYLEAEPMTETEQWIAEYLKECGRIKNFSPKDNLINYGLNSLKLLKLLSMIEKKYSIRLSLSGLAKNLTIETIATIVDQTKDKGHEQKDELVHQANQSEYQASNVQKRMFLLNQRNPLSLDYNITFVFRLTGRFERDKFTKAVLQCLQKHKIMASSFYLKGEELFYKINNLELPNIEFIQNHSEFSRLEELEEAALKTFIRPYEMKKDTLYRIKVYEYSPDATLVLFDFHHIIFDGASSVIFLQDIQKAYENEILPELEYKYADYILWQSKLFQTDRYKRQEEYWKSLFNTPTKLFEDFEDIRDKSGTVFKRITIEKNIPMKQEIDQQCKVFECTKFSYFVSILNIVLSKYYGLDDITVGTVTEGRSRLEFYDVIGMFVNTIALRNSVRFTDSLAEFINQVQGNISAALENSDVPYERIVELSKSKRSRNPIFDICIRYEEELDKVMRLGGLSCNIREVELENTVFDLEIVIKEAADQYIIQFNYAKEIYHEDTIERLADLFYTALAETMNKYYIKLEDIELISEDERRTILQTFNNTFTEYESNSSVASLFGHQVKKNPDSIAVTFEKVSLTYKELDIKSDSIADRLINMGIGIQDNVAVLAEKGVEVVIALLGIIKTGASYVPIDLKYPKDRIDYMIHDCKPKAVITFQAELNTELDVIDLETFDYCAVTAKSGISINSSDILYTIYTSGTTGNPKGVSVSNRGVIRLVRNTNYATLNENTVILQTGAISFDASTFEIWGALLNGGCICMARNDVITVPLRMKQVIREQNVNTMFLTQALFNQLITYDSSLFSKIKYLYIGGDKVSQNHIRLFVEDTNNANVLLYNMYGPTENTTFSTFYQIPFGPVAERIPIGKPISNSTAYILRGTRLCGIGIIGELCLGGDGVADGYLNQQQLTNEKFIDNPFGSGKLYRSGDLARWRSDGNIDFLGRADKQVKIRGYRIELGEIESRIKDISMVDDAVVITRDDSGGELRLNAYFVASGKIDSGEIIKELRKSLPEYMIPVSVMQLEKLPVTRNGKVDVQQLPRIELTDDNNYVSASNVLEKTLTDIYKEVLDISRVGVKDNFFKLGGHSLKVIKVLNQIDERVGIKLELNEVFSNPTVESLCILISKKASGSVSDSIGIPKSEDKQYYAMSSAQKRLFIINKIEGNETIYNMPGMFEVRGKLDYHKLKEALKKLTERHESLRTSFHMIEGEPVQAIHPEICIDIAWEEASEREYEEIFREFVKPFDLEKAPLFRIKAVKYEEERYMLLIDTHHIISDGMSVNNIFTEFGLLYQGDLLEPLHIQYRDYSEWMSGRDISKQKEYWLNIFHEEIPVLDMPVDFIRPAEKNYIGNALITKLHQDTRNIIKSYCDNHEITEYMFFLSALMIVLSKYSRQEDIVVGSPVSGRNHRDTEKLIGMFVNTLALRARPEKTKKYEDFLQEIKDICIKALENQEYPFDELVDAVETQRDASRNPLFDVMLALQNNDMAQFNINDITLSEISCPTRIVKFDLAFDINQLNGDIKLEYREDLFKEENIRYLMNHFINVIQDILRSGQDVIIQNISMLDEAERITLLEEFNDTKAHYKTGISVVSIFEQQVRNCPDKIALMMDKRQLTYQELNKKANQLAGILLAHNTNKEDFIAISASRSIEFVIGILGVLKAGAAYVPIDPEYPEDRISYMLEDCKARILLTDREKPLGAASVTTVMNLMDESIYQGNGENLNLEIKPNDLMYIIYTSGTTGRPKGVMVEHDGVINLREYFLNNHNIGSSDIILQFASFSFDATISEITMSLLTGAALCIISSEMQKDARLFEKFIKSQHITFAVLPPQFLAQVDISSLRGVITAGSESSQRLVRDNYKKTSYSNDYGPTEATVCATHWRCAQDETIPDRIPIGKPIENKQIYMLDGMELCAIGIPGELCIAGVGIARGYLNKPELTDEKFIPNPFGCKKLYRSGDLARWLPDGTIEFLGRIDEQVKIRGFRIELGEIAYVLRSLESIKDTAVIVKRDQSGDEAIYAYYVSDQVMSSEELQSYLSCCLPEYMIPAYMIQLDEIPMTKNGKVDKLKLPDRILERHSAFAEPESSVEKALVLVMEEILGIERISMEDDFFDMGGDSIKAIRLSSKLRERGYMLNVKDIMQIHRLSGIAKKIFTTEFLYEQDEITGEVPLTPIQRWFFKSNFPVPDHYNQSILLESEERFFPETVQAVWHELVSHHDILRAYFKDGRQTIREAKSYDSVRVSKSELVEDSRVSIGECIYRLGTEIQKGMSIDKGPLVKCHIFKAKDRDYLLICIHHLLIDGVSWRIVIEDFETLYQQIKCGKQVSLPKKTASYRDWSESLMEYAKCIEIKNEIGYWTDIITNLKNNKVLNAMSDRPLSNKVETIKVSLNKSDTADLLYQVNKTYHTEIQDILLTALGRAIYKIYKKQRFGIELEGHGREELHKPVTIDRTVGWFTCTYPVILQVGMDIENDIINTKEMLRKIPNHGIGYSILQHLNPDCMLYDNTEFIFNYLGEFKHKLTDESGIKISQFQGGLEIDERNLSDRKISFNSMIFQNELTISVTFDTGVYEKSYIQPLAEGFLNELTATIRHCLDNRLLTVKTASDFGAGDLDTEDISFLNELIDGLE